MMQKEEQLLQIKQQIIAYIYEINSEDVKRFFLCLPSGKMLRSKLILSICPKHPDIIKLCAIVEMIQSASLLHDDVIDKSLLRRGDPSINALFGDKNAIMLGDIFYSKAFFELLKFDNNIAKSIADCVVRLSRGEIHDVMMSKGFQNSQKKYFSMIEDKTASLIASSAQSAGILANLDSEKYYNYGLKLGIAFQIIDDLLDIFGDRKKIGKPAMSDYAEGKTTLPYIILYEKMHQEDKEKLIKYFKKNSKEINHWILEKMQEFNIFEIVLNIAKSYGRDALKLIKGNTELERIVEEVIFREF